MATQKSEPAATAEQTTSAAPPPWDDPSVTPPIAVLLARASEAVGAVRKTQQAPGAIGGYQFRGVDAVVNAVHPVFTRLGIVMLPEVLETQREPVTTKGGGGMMNVTARVRFTFVGPAGDRLQVTTLGEAADSGDKATTKAQSVALRVALLQALLLPTDEPDPDEQGYERAARSERPSGRAERPSEPAAPSPAEVEHQAVMDIWNDAYGALTESQQQWVREHWGDNTPPNRLDRAGMAKAIEWMAANVPPA